MKISKSKKNLNELKNINKERNKIAIQVNQCKNEIQLLKEKRNNQYKSFEDYILPKIRDEIRDKLEQYHYIENDLFPDIYKHLSYVQNNFIQSNKNNSFKKKIIYLIYPNFFNKKILREKTHKDIVK